MFPHLPKWLSIHEAGLLADTADLSGRTLVQLVRVDMQSLQLQHLQLVLLRDLRHVLQQPFEGVFVRALAYFLDVTQTIGARAWGVDCMAAWARPCLAVENQ